MWHAFPEVPAKICSPGSCLRARSHVARLGEHHQTPFICNPDLADSEPYAGLLVTR